MLGQVGGELGLGRFGRRLDIGFVQHEIFDGPLVPDIAVDQVRRGLGQGCIAEKAQDQLLAFCRLALVLEILGLGQAAHLQHLVEVVRCKRAERVVERGIGAQHLAQLLLRNAQPEAVGHLVQGRVLREILQHHRGNAQVHRFLGGRERAELLGHLVHLALVGTQELAGVDLLVADARHRIAAQVGDDIVDAKSRQADQQTGAHDLAGPGFCKNTQTIEHLRRSSWATLGFTAAARAH